MLLLGQDLTEVDLESSYGSLPPNAHSLQHGSQTDIHTL